MPAGRTQEIVSLTDSSGGTASDTIPEQTAAYVEADIANAIATLAAKLNEIIDAINHRT